VREVCMQYPGKGHVKGTDLGLARRKWGNMRTTDNADSMDWTQDCVVVHMLFVLENCMAT
jgi:hypothetical protein